MLRMILTGLGFTLAVAAGVVVVPTFFGSHTSVETASLDGSAVLQDEEPSVLTKVRSMLPWVPDHEPPMTKARALADRDAMRRQNLNSFFPEAPEGWERLEWNAFFQGKFGLPDDEKGAEEEITVYLNGDKSIYLRAQRRVPTGPMVADLLQIQRYVEKGGKLGDLDAYRPTIDHTLEVVRETAAGWSSSTDKKFWHFETINGVSFIVGTIQSKPNDFPYMKFYHGSLGGGVVLKVRSDAPKEDVIAVLEGIDMTALNHLQDVPHPLIGEGLPEFVIETPEEWLDNKGFKLRKVERVIPPKPEPEAEVVEDKEKDEEVIAKSEDKDH